MKEQNKTTLKEQKLQKKNNNGAKLVLFIICIILVAGYFSLNDLIDLQKLFVNDNIEESQPKNIDIVKEDNIEKAPSEDNLENHTLVGIETFAPVEAIERFPQNIVEDLSPYNGTEFIDANNWLNHEDLMKKIDNYRIFLANANELMHKFSEDIEYSKNLIAFLDFDFPKEVQEIIFMLQEYNKMLQNCGAKTEKVFIFNTDIFDKFLKIDKVTDQAKKMLALKKEIEDKKTIFDGYIFSSTVQESFLK